MNINFDDLVTREAIGLRGRAGWDVWLKFLLASADSQERFLIRHGVPADRIDGVRDELVRIVKKEMGVSNV